MSDYILKVTSAYRCELARNACILQSNYQRIREDKANAEEMQKKIEGMEKKLNLIQPIMANISALKGGIDKNV